MIAATIGSALAVATGYYDMYLPTLGVTHEYFRLHLAMGWLLLQAVAGLSLWRWFLYSKPMQRVRLAYLLAVLLVIAMTYFEDSTGTDMVSSMESTHEWLYSRQARDANICHSCGDSRLGASSWPG